MSLGFNFLLLNVCPLRSSYNCSDISTSPSQLQQGHLHPLPPQFCILYTFPHQAQLMLPHALEWVHLLEHGDISVATPLKKTNSPAPRSLQLQQPLRQGQDLLLSCSLTLSPCFFFSCLKLCLSYACYRIQSDNMCKWPCVKFPSNHLLHLASRICLPILLH